MRIIFFLLALAFTCSSTFCSYTSKKESIYVGSTPAHHAVRDFLGISLTDSIDFIRWKLMMHSDRYELEYKYGVSKPGTPGFENEKSSSFSGELRKEKNHYYLGNESKTFSILEINSNLLHLLDENKNLLIGNGGYSYTLNIDVPVKTHEFNLLLKITPIKNSMVFEGRTPCQELSELLDLNKGPACNKLKWYFIFYTDSLSGEPSYYLTDGMGYRKETMAKGKWQIIREMDGRIIYRLNPEKQAYTLYLLKADENILLFIDPQGNLLVGNEDFSYTLNRRNEEYPPVSR